MWYGSKTAISIWKTPSVLNTTEFGITTTHILVKFTWEVRDVEVGRTLITLGLEASVEALLRLVNRWTRGREGMKTYTSKANLVAETVKTSNALL